MRIGRRSANHWLRFPKTKAGERPKTKAEIALGGAVEFGAKKAAQAKATIAAYRALQKIGFSAEEARALLLGMAQRRGKLGAKVASTHIEGGRHEQVSTQC